MITKLSSHQIPFFPYIEFWKKMAQSDIMDFSGLYDQFDKGDYQHRVKIGTDDKYRWLTLPVGNKDLHRLCRDIELKNELVPRLYNLLEGWYRDYPNWEVYKDKLYEIFCEYTYQYYWELNFKIILWLRDLLNLETILSIAPEDSDISANNKLIHRIKYYGCTTYISGKGGHCYLDENLFVDNNINLEYVKTVDSPDDLKTVSILTYLMRYDIDTVRRYVISE